MKWWKRVEPFVLIVSFIVLVVVVLWMSVQTVSVGHLWSRNPLWDLVRYMTWLGNAMVVAVLLCVSTRRLVGILRARRAETNGIGHTE